MSLADHAIQFPHAPAQERKRRNTTLRAAALATAVAITAAVSSARADQNWDGDNAVGNFSFNNNWFGDTQPAWGFGNGSLRFQFRNNGSQSSLFLDYGSWQQTNDIIWETTFGAGLPWNSNGNGLDFNQRLENRSSFTQTVNVPLSGAKNGATQIELNPVNGDLVINGNIFNDNNKPYQVWGNNNKTLTINSEVRGNNSVSFTLQQNSNVVMNFANTYGGATTILAGRMYLGTNAPSGSAGALGNATSTVVLGDTTGSENASLFTNGAFTVGRNLNARSGNTGVITLGGNTATMSTFSGNISLGTANSTAKSVTLVNLAGGGATFSGVIDESTNVPASNVTIGSATHTGTVRLSNTANSYGGVTTVNGVILEVTEVDNANANSSIGNATSSASNLVFSGGTLRYIGGGASSTNRLFTFDANGATLDANAAVNFTGTGALVASGTGNRTLSLIGSSAGSVASDILNPSSGLTSLTKGGTNTWTLSGGNTYGGTTSINNGKLILNSTHSGGGDYTVASGATLGGGGTISFNSPHNVTINGTISPGTSPGKFTIGTNSTTVMAPAGQYTWEINAQTGTQGVNWDFLSLQAVSVTATNTPGQKFKIKVVSLDGSNNPNPVPGWVPNSYQIYTIATFTGSGITAAILDRFELDLSQFQNQVGDGGMYLGVNGQDLIIVNVPEPSGALIAIGGAGAATMGGRRSRRRRFA